MPKNQGHEDITPNTSTIFCWSIKFFTTAQYLEDFKCLFQLDGFERNSKFSTMTIDGTCPITLIITEHARRLKTGHQLKDGFGNSRHGNI